MHKKGGGLLQPRAKRKMLNAHGGGELEDEIREAEFNYVHCRAR